MRLVAPFLTGSANKRSVGAIAIYTGLAFLAALGMATTIVLVSGTLINGLVPEGISSSAFGEITSFNQWLRQSKGDVLITLVGITSIVGLTV